MPRAVRGDRAQYVGTRHKRSKRPGARDFFGPERGRPRRRPPPHAVIRTLCPGGQSVRLRRTTRRQRRARHSWQRRAGRAKQAGRAPGGDAVLHRSSGGRERSGRHRHTVRDQRAVAKPGPPHVVRIGTDIFRRRGKYPRRRVRCGGTGRSECALPRPAQPAAKGWPRKTGGPRPPPPVGILPKICYNEGN